MNLTEIYEVCDQLIDSGWKTWEVERLCHYLTAYKQTSMDLPDLIFDIQKLEFLRWMVQTGRLSD